MSIAAISSEICASSEYHSSMIGLPQEYIGVVGDIDCDLIYGGAISNLGDVRDGRDYAVAHISCLGVAMRLINYVGVDASGYEFGDIG